MFAAFFFILKCKWIGLEIDIVNNINACFMKYFYFF